MSFVKELEQLINRHSKENESNTPDFILAQFLESCLAAWNTGIQQRETWYGRDATPTSITKFITVCSNCGDKCCNGIDCYYTED